MLNNKYEVIADERKKVAKRYCSELKLKYSGLSINVTIWGNSPEEVDENVKDFLKTEG
jgi:hypothetical protein